MADVTINDLNRTTPTGNLLLPISNGNVTYSAPLSDIQVNYNSIANKPALATVATTGSYNDLINKPTAGSTPDMLLFTTTTTWTAPAGVTKAKATVIGAGGGSGGGRTVTIITSGGMGGCGGVAIGYITVTPGNAYTITIGTGGTGGANYNGGSNTYYPGSAGGASSIVHNSGTITGGGGSGGQGASSTSNLGIGAAGAGTGGILSYSDNNSSQIRYGYGDGGRWVAGGQRGENGAVILEWF
jgi:hypothetical protein